MFRPSFQNSPVERTGNRFDSLPVTIGAPVGNVMRRASGVETGAWAICLDEMIAYTM